jgi:hypothetical protein
LRPQVSFLIDVLLGSLVAQDAVTVLLDLAVPQRRFVILHNLGRLVGNRLGDDVRHRLIELVLLPARLPFAALETRDLRTLLWRRVIDDTVSLDHLGRLRARALERGRLLRTPAVERWSVQVALEVLRALDGRLVLRVGDDGVLRDCSSELIGVN